MDAKFGVYSIGFSYKSHTLIRLTTKHKAIRGDIFNAPRFIVKLGDLSIKYKTHSSSTTMRAAALIKVIDYE